MHTRPARGFTLIEIIVSVGIFAIVMLVATSAYYSLINLDRRARATNETVNNLSFAVDAMTRGIRTGTNYQCLNGSPDAYGNSTTGTCTSFTYQDTSLSTSGSVAVKYILKTNGTIGRCEGGGACNDSTASSITDPSITITNLSFYVRGAGNTDDIQGQVLFTIRGTMPAEPGKVSTFVIEEAATQRQIDL